ncbi:MAG: murein biosynthesis integral membrane protein MurJ [Holosporales bacterium]|jgi:putative peptidoglycan lipid II flippase|nr:murein biosynthesis integral membrane protein MurJ [Holosporales bacterium]
MGLARRFLTVSGLTASSRILGVVREAAFSHFLGAGVEMDAFLIAYKFPSFFRKFFSEGGFQSIFVPFYSDFTEAHKYKAAQYFSSRIFRIILFITIIVTLLVVVFANEFVLIMAPGFVNDPEKLSLATEFTKIIFPSVIFIAISSVYSGILMSHRQFFLFTMWPILGNLILIASLFMGQDLMSAARRLSYGVLIAGLSQFCYSWWSARRCSSGIPFSFRIKITKRMRDFLRKLPNVLASAGISQINIFLDSLFGSIMPTGVISYIYFADRFIQFPLALFGISMGVILVPEISKRMRQESTNGVNKVQNEAIALTLRMTLPAVIVFLSLAHPLISILYGHGKFSGASVDRTANVLRVFSIGLPAYVVAKIMSSALLAQKDSKTPITATLVAVSSNIILSVLLMFPLQEIGIAIATSVSGFVNVYVMYKKSKSFTFMDMPFIRSMRKVLLSSFIMFIFIEVMKIIIKDPDDVCLRTMMLIFIIIVGLISYLITLLILGDDILKFSIATLKKKFMKKKGE